MSTNTQVDPYYVQISKKEAAHILGRSVAELDRLRDSDSRCPKGFQEKGKGRTAPTRFRLSDIYQYSDQLMKDSEDTEASNSNVYPMMYPFQETDQ